LIQAADHYDRRRDIQFKTLAEHRIRGAMLDYLRSLDPLPRAVRRFLRDRDAVLAHWERRGDCSASEEDIANKMGLPIERYRRLLQIAQSAEAIDLSQEGARTSIGTNPHDAAWRHEVDDAIHTLPACERSVMLLLRDGYSLSEIAKRIDDTRARVSQIKKQAIIRLRTALGVRPVNQHSSTPATHTGHASSPGSQTPVLPADE